MGIMYRLLVNGEQYLKKEGALMEKIKRTAVRKSRGFIYFVKAAALTALGLILVLIGFLLAGYFIIF